MTLSGLLLKQLSLGIRVRKKPEDPLIMKQLSKVDQPHAISGHFPDAGKMVKLCKTIKLNLHINESIIYSQDNEHK